MSQTAIPVAGRRPVEARTVVTALSTLAAAAIGLSVLPLGFVGLLTTEFGWASSGRPSMFAAPALVLGMLGGARLASLGRGAGPAWWVVATGALATAAITAGQRLAGGNTMWMSNWPGVARPWVRTARSI